MKQQITWGSVLRKAPVKRPRDGINLAAYFLVIRFLFDVPVSAYRSIRLDVLIPLSAALLLVVSGQQQQRPATLSRAPLRLASGIATTPRPTAREAS